MVSPQEERATVQHVLFLVFLTASAGVFALLEIQIEGGAGWAASLPTWRVDNRWTRIALGGRPLTGYHLFAQLFVLLIVHLPFAMGLSAWSWRVEARVLAFLVLFWVVEDFLWFALNPRYGLRTFRREGIPWHASAWWWIMPREYWLFLPVGAVLYAWSW